MRYIAEVRRGWLSRTIIGYFDTFEEADKALKVFKRENPCYLGPDDFYEVNSYRV